MMRTSSIKNIDHHQFFAFHARKPRNLKLCKNKHLYLTRESGMAAMRAARRGYSKNAAAPQPLTGAQGFHAAAMLKSPLAQGG